MKLMNDKKNIINTYSTSQIAKIVELHPNTVRIYEEWGLIQKPERKNNGYRVFYDIHIKQFELVKKALQIEVLQSGLRKRIIEAVKLSARYQFENAIKLTEEYIIIAGNEIKNAEEAVIICQTLYSELSETGNYYKRAEAAKELGITIDTIRNWEMNGLIKVKRKENGYRIYNENDMKRLKIIRSLRCANYSLSAILRMLNKLDSENKNESDMFDLLNNPDDDENIISACDKLVDSLEKAIKNAYDVIEILKTIKKMTK